LDSDLLVEFARRILVSFTTIIMPSGGPRPKKHESVRKAVEDLLRAGVRSYQIKGSLRINYSWIHKLRTLIEAFGTTSPVYPSMQGRPRKIHAQAEDDILNFLDDNLTAYLDEI
jgi:hypothetical protein